MAFGETLINGPAASRLDSIFLDEETLTLFAVQKLADGHTAGALPQTAKVMQFSSRCPIIGLTGWYQKTSGIRPAKKSTVVIAAMTPRGQPAGQA